MKAWLIPISLVVLADTAHADQCAWVDATAAQKAKTILARSSKLIDYCEPCGDKAPGVPRTANSVEVNVADGEFKEVSINGTPVDLAYVFVKTDATHYRNLAALAGCPATGVSPSLTIEPETPHGVLIQADDDALPPTIPDPPAPAAAVTTITPVLPPVPPPQIYVYTTTTHEVAWFAIALAAAGGFITGSALTLALITVRRRRAMRPRAVDFSARAE